MDKRNNHPILLASIILAVIIFSLLVVSSIPLINFVNPTSTNNVWTNNNTLIINSSITEQNLGSLIYNWNGTNYSIYDSSLLIMYNFDDSAQDTLKSSYSITTNANAYVYEDLTSVSDYTIQSGDVLEYDVAWTSTTDYVAFDYTTANGTSLRGNANDQNGLGAHPGTDLSSYALNKWYHRKISVPVAQVGHLIQNYDIVCEKDTTGTPYAYLKNITITDGAGTIRKVIYTNGSITHSTHIFNSGSTTSLSNVTGSGIADDASIYSNYGHAIDTQWTSLGKYGNALSFDGRTSKVVSNKSITLGTSGTMSAWIYANNFPATNNRIIGSVGNTAYQLISNSATHYLAVIADGGSTVSSNYIIPANTWLFVAAAFNSTTVRFYVNGTLVNWSSGSFSGATFTPQIGWDSATGIDYWNGSIDEVRILNITLSDTEIYEQYASNLQKFNSTRWYFYANQSQNLTTRLSDGIYSYQIFATNSSGSFNSSDLRTLNIDSTYPQINFTTPTPTNGTNQSLTNVIINVSVLEQNLNSLIYNWNGSNYTLSIDDLGVFYSGIDRSDILYVNPFMAAPNNWNKNNLTLGLILAMTMNNNSLFGESASYVADLSGNRINGSVYGHSFYNSSGKFGGAYQFDGGDDSINTTSNILNGTNAFTILLWARPNAFGNYKGIIGKGIADANVITIQSHTSGQIYCDVDNGTSSSYAYSSSGLLGIGSWTQIAMVFNGSASSNAERLKLYINGSNVSLSFSGTIPAQTGSSNTGVLTIGQLGYASNYFNGSIDEVKIWNRSLSSSEIQQIYNSETQKINPSKWYLYINQSKNSLSGLDNGLYNYQVFTNDLAGNFNQTEQRRITIDTSSPSINSNSQISLNWIYPTSNINVTQNQFFNISVNITCLNSSCGNINVTLDPDINTQYNFTTCGASGRFGPNQTQCNTNYTNTTLQGLVNVANGLQNWTVPASGIYKIEVYGAASGVGTYSGTTVSGKGTYMSGQFSLNSGDILKIIVGQKGGSSSGGSYNGAGGGGGTFVVYANNTPLIIAGGGGASGGYSSYTPTSYQGQNATTNTTGGSSARGGAGGSNGTGGTTNGYHYTAGSGGGLLSDGINGSANSAPGQDGGGGGASILNGSLGGLKATRFPAEAADGGFGGGGGGTPIAGGGGGGYSGGAGSLFTADIQVDGGGGGGSYNVGTNQNNSIGWGTSHGRVLITFLSSSNTKSGAVSMNSSATPFYTNITNPYNLSLNLNESQVITWQVNATGTPNIPYTFFVYANSTSNLSIGNQTYSLNITILDTVAPIANLTYPINGITYINNVTNLNYTYYDYTGGGYCWWSNSSGVWNSSAVNAGINFTNLISLDGNNSWTIYCNDSSGNINFSTITFTKKIPRIGISWIYPTSNINATQNQFFNVSVNVSCDYGNCGNINVTLDPSEGTQYNFTNCGVRGYIGPTQNNCTLNYTGTSLAGTVNVTAGYQRWVVPTTGTYRIEANGAAGGLVSCSGYSRGYGARVTGEFNFQAGEVLFIVVGQLGSDKTCSDWGAGGGGFSLVAKNTTSSSYIMNSVYPNAYITPLIVAAGAGGTGDSGGNNGNPNATVFISGNGSGGLSAGDSGGGAGVIGDGAAGSCGASGPRSFLNGSNGTTCSYFGGFGGGGAPFNAGGGGGGFTGGNGSANGYSGLGGTSYNSGINQINLSSANSRAGYIVITYITGKTGTVSMSTNATPFYTNVTNPYNLSLNEGESQIITWYVNATGNSNNTYPFFAYTNLTLDQSINNKTGFWNVTIIDSPSVSTSFTSPTLGNGTTTNNNYALINTSIINSDLNSLIYNWNGTNYTIYNSSLVLMMNFDNNSALGENLTYAVDVSAYGNNGTLINGTLWNSSGKYGSAMQLDGVDDYINITKLNLNTNTLTISAWIKGSYTGSYSGVIFSRDSTQPVGIGYRGLTGQLSYTWNDNNANTYDWISGLSPNPNIWTFIALSLNSTQATLYTSNLSGLYSSTNNVPHSLQLLDTDLYLGYDAYSADRVFNGSIDEVRVWNRSLSESEIYEQYISNLNKASSSQWYLYVNQSRNSSTALSNGRYNYQVTVINTANTTTATDFRTIILDSNNPNATLINPTNNTSSTNLSYNFTANLSDSFGIANVTLYIYNSSGIYNQTITTFTAGITNTIIGTVVTLINGIYTWFYQIFDFAGNSILTSNNTLRVDNIYPTFSAYYDNNGSLSGNGLALFNVTLANTNGTVILQINNINVTATNITANVYNASYSLSTPAVYSYKWYAYGNGVNKNFNTSLTRSYTLNISVNPTNCVNLTNASSYLGRIANGSGFYNITSSITLCSATYTATQDMFRIQSSNIVVDCNYATLTGDNGAGDIGIEVNNKQNVTIQNCIVNNFYDGLSFISAHNLRSINNTVINGSEYGIYILNTNNGTLYNNNLSGNSISYYIDTSNTINFTNNYVTSSKTYGMTMRGRSAGNWVYNNYFNNALNIRLDASDSNNWNITKSLGTNIILGSYLGGNYWVNPTNSGFSNTCADANGDGLCDAGYTIKNKNTDNHALAATDNAPPNISVYTAANNSFVNGNLTIQASASDDFGVSYVLFQYKNVSIDYTTLCNVSLPDSRTTNVYSCLWPSRLYSNISSGYDFKAIAFDAAGNNASDIVHYTIDRSIPYAKDLSVIYPSGQYYVRNGQEVILGINASDASEDGISAGINNSVVDLTSLNYTGNTTMIFATGNTSTAQWSWWNISVIINSSTGQKSAIAYVNDNTVPINNRRSSDRFFIQVDNNLPTYDSVSNNGPVYNNQQMSFLINAYDNTLLRGYIFSSNITGTWINDSEVSLNGIASSIAVSKIVNTGNYSYRFYIYDNAGNMNATAISNFNVLGDLPIFTINLMNQSDNAVITTNNVTFNFSYINGIALNCSIIIDGEINQTTNFPSANSILNFNNYLSEGTHSWSVVCYNNATDLDVWAPTRTIIVDTFYPQISILYPANTTYNNVNVINYSYNEANIYGCWYSLYNGAINSTLRECNNFTGLTSSQGSNIWKVYIKDLADNINSSTIIFTVDTTSPNSTLIAPPNNTLSENFSYNFTANISDNNGLANATLNIYNLSGIVNQTTINIVQGTLQATIGIVVSLIDGIYTWFYQISDITGNLFTTTNYTLTINNTYPTFSNYSDNNGSLTSAGIGYFNVSVLNSNGTVILEINNTNVSAINTTSNYYTANYTFQTNSTYAYRWYSWSNTSKNNFNYSIYRNYSVNNPQPLQRKINIAWINPTSNLNVTQTEFFNVSINVTCIDANCGNINVTLDPITGNGTAYLMYNSSENGADSFSWQEIINNSVGSPIWNGGNIDDTYYTLNLPFGFNFYGTNYSRIYVSSNGRIHFTSSGASYTTINIPSSSYNVAAIFNYDMYVSSAQGKVYYANLTNPNRVVIQSRNIDYCCSVTSNNFTYEVILYEDGRIKFQYAANNPNFSGYYNNGLAFNSTSHLLTAVNSPNQYKGMATTFYPPGYAFLSQKGGVVSTNTSATPFYTITQNPYVVSLGLNESSVITWSVNASGRMPNTAYEFYVYANSTSNFSIGNQTYRINISINDTILPAVSVTYPINYTYNTNVRNINYTYADYSGGGYCWYSNSSGLWNSSIVNAGINFTDVNSIDDSNSWTVYCNDSSNNINYSSINFVKKVPSMNLDWIYPTENINATKNQFFNISVNLTCKNANCGNINVTLDPITGNGTAYLMYNSSENGADSFSWQEIINNSVGSPIWNGGNIDDTYYTLNLPFGFNFYGTNYSRIYVSSNGRIHFTSSGASYTTINIPSSSYNVAAIFNYDMYVSSAQGKVYYANLTNPNRVVIQSRNIDYCCSVTSNNFTYEVILYEDGRIKFQYAANNPNFSGYYNNGLAFNSTSHLLTAVNSPNQYKGMATTFYPPWYPLISAKGGIVSNTIGASPFYTIVQNPYNLSLNENDSMVITWLVNASGNYGTYPFFIYSNLTSDESIGNITSKLNITIANITMTDNVYSVFYNYSDNNGSQNSIGIGYFSVSVNNTNGTVWLSINNTNISATNIAGNLFNASYNFTQGKNYTYRWYSYGNGNLTNINNSGLRNYSVNTPDITPPLISVILPVNTTYRTTSINFNISINENANYCSYSLDNAQNITMSINLSLTGANASNNSMTQGTHIVIFSCNDTSGNLNSTSKIFSIDSIAPNLTFSSPLNSSYNNRNININITASSDASRIWFNRGLGNETYVLNITKLFSEGNNIIYGYANDSIGNLNTTSISFYIDSLVPTINNTSPVEKTYTTAIVSFNITTNEDSYCWIILNSSTTYLMETLDNRSFNYTAILGDSAYNITYYCNDSLNNIATKNVLFGVKTVPPQITLNVPAANRNYNNRTMLFNFTPMASDGIDTCELWGDWVGLWHKNGTLTSINNYTDNFFTRTLEDGTYIWNIWCNNTIGQNDWSTQGNLSFTIDQTPPQVSFLSPTNISYNTTIITIQVQNNSDANLVWIDNQTDNITYYSSFDINLANGNYTYIVYSSDLAGNINSSRINFYVDTSTPLFSSIVSNNASIIGNGLALFNATILNSNGSAWIVINNTILESTNTSATEYNASYNILFEGNYEYYWYSYSNGSSNLYAASNTTIYTVNATDIIAPNATLNLPENNSFVNSSVNFSANLSDITSIIMDTESGIRNATINIYNNSGIVNQTTTNFAEGTLSTSVGIIVSLVDGIYNWFYSLFDFNGNIFTTQNRTLTVDSIAPTIQIIYPQNNSKLNTDTPTINYSISDDYPQSCWYDDEGYSTGNLLANCRNISGEYFTEGEHNLTIYANDSSGNVNSLRMGFAIDITPPLVILNNPTEQFFNDSSNLTSVVFNCSASDKIQIKNISLYITRPLDNNFIINQSQTVSGTSNYSYWELNLSVGNYTWNCLSYDVAGNSIFASNNRTIVLNYSDSDGDGIRDTLDNINGNSTNLTSSGINNLNISFGGNSTQTSYDDVREVAFLDSSQKLANFTYNFTESRLDFSKINLIKGENYLIVNISEQLQKDYTKSIFIENNNFTQLCAKDAEITSITEMTVGCDAGDETNFTDCIGNNTGVSRNSLSCVDNGTLITVSNLAHSALRGTPAESTPAVVPSSTGGGGGGATISNITVNKTISECANENDCGFGKYCLSGKCLSYECNQNSDCTDNKSCFEHKCVKLFDIKIIHVDSPTPAGRFVNFTYYLKAMAKINNDVTINFWLEKDGKKITSGKDTIYIGEYEEKTENTRIFIPKNTKPDVYDFYVSVSYDGYTAVSNRQIEVEEYSLEFDKRNPILYYLLPLLILIIIILIIIIIKIEKKKIKEAFEYEEEWILTHKLFLALLYLSLFTLGLILILGFLGIIKLPGLALYKSSLENFIENLLIPYAWTIFAITAGIIFFILAKRRKKKEEEKYGIKIKLRKHHKNYIEHGLRKIKHKIAIAKIKRKIRVIDKEKIKREKQLEKWTKGGYDTGIINKNDTFQKQKIEEWKKKGYDVDSIKKENSEKELVKKWKEGGYDVDSLKR
jgi:hypothetical protein